MSKSRKHADKDHGARLVHSTSSGRRPGHEQQARRNDLEDDKDVVNPQDTTTRTNVIKYAAYHGCQVEE